MKRYFKHIFFSVLLMSLSTLSAQEVLLSEDFNECMVPTDWITNISYGDGVGFYVGLITNDNSDSSSIDGTCMMVFDDDILGNNTPTFVAEVSTPFFDTKGYKNIRLQTDVSFRAYGTSNFSVYVEEMDGTRILVAQYGEGQQTGAQFSDFATLSLDLSFFTTSEELRLVYIYDDMEMYAWYAGIDNVNVIGSGEGEIVVIEQFNECAVPEGWSTNILRGEHDWVLGYNENSKSSSNSMNGTCFAFFDDDLIGKDVPFSTADLKTPWFDGTQYATFLLELELIFRRYGDFENISVYVNDGENEQLVKEFFDAVGGPQFTNYDVIQLDLTEYRSNNMQVIFRYDDGNEWGWWTGIDNVKIIGHGSINDLCDKSEVLEIGKACLVSKNKNAVFSGPENSCYPNGQGGLWYRLVAPEDGFINLVNKADYNDLISIYSGPCDALVEMSCTNRDEHGFKGEEVTFNATKDQTYFIRISGIDSNYGLSRGKNCISANYINSIPQPSLEDLIEMAMPLMINGSAIAIDNRNGNIEATLPTDNLLVRSDLWYSFTTDTITDVAVEVMSDFAESTVVYDSMMNEVHNQLEGGDFSVNDLMTDSKYYIQVSGTFAIIEGGALIKLNSEEKTQPQSDDCFASEVIMVNDTISYDNSAQTFSGVNTSCDIYSDQDRWFSFVTDGSLLYLNIDSDFISNATIFEGPCDELEEFTCYSGIVSCDGSIPIGGLEADETYYLQISSSQTNNNNVSSAISFSLSDEAEELPDLNINVATQCLDGGYAELQVLVTSDVPYTMSGNADGDMLFEGDSYIIVVTPEVGCEQSLKGVIDCQNTTCNLNIEPLLSYPSCNGNDDGSILLEVENGLGPFIYAWAHTEENVSEFPSLGSGTYEVTVTDALGCVAATTITVEEPTLLVSMASSIDQQTAGMNDGSASVEAEGGTLPYTYLWSNGEETAEANDLAPGDYSVTITDYNGCSESHNVIIAELDCAFTLAATLVHVTCYGGLDGSITLSSEAEINSVLWDHDTDGTIITGLSTGVYTATVTLTNGCEKIESFSIEQPDEIMFFPILDYVKCFGESNGLIDVDVEGGNGDFTYLWADGSITSTINELPAGLYALTVTDHLGCSSETSYEITEPDELQVASSMVTDLTCSYSQDGQVCVFVEGGTLPYQFNWEGLEDGMSKMTDLAAGTYNLMVVDSNECVLNDVQVITAPGTILVEVEILTISTENDGHIKINIEGGVGPYEITWYLNEEIVGTGSEIFDLAEGIYSAVIIDANGCTFETSDYLLSTTSIEELEPTEFTIFPNPARSTFTIHSDKLDSNVKLRLISSTGVDLSHLVSFSRNNNEVICENLGLVSGLYYIEISGESKSRLALVISEF